MNCKGGLRTLCITVITYFSHIGTCYDEDIWILIYRQRNRFCWRRIHWQYSLFVCSICSLYRFRNYTNQKSATLTPVFIELVVAQAQPFHVAQQVALFEQQRLTL